MEIPIISIGDKNHCYYFIGFFLAMFIIKRNARFQLRISKNSSSQTP